MELTGIQFNTRMKSTLKIYCYLKARNCGDCWFV